MVGIRPPDACPEGTRAAAMVYRHANLVCRGFTAHPREWRFSTLHRWELASALTVTAQVGLQPDGARRSELRGLASGSSG